MADNANADVDQQEPTQTIEKEETAAPATPRNDYDDADDDDDDVTTNAEPEEDDGEELDPRIEGALGELNRATDDINIRERELEEAKEKFKNQMTQIQKDLQTLAAKCGRKTIEKARPYHNALAAARKAHGEARQAAIRYEKAGEQQRKAKDRVASLEGKLKENKTFNDDLMQQLNRETQKVMDSDRLRHRAEVDHGAKTQAFKDADAALMVLAKSKRKMILKSKPYFNSKAQHDRKLHALKQEIERSEAGVRDAKGRVAASLAKLESISQEIHDARKKRREEQQQGQQEESKATPKDDVVSKKIAQVQADTARREAAEKERRATEIDETEQAIEGLDGLVLASDNEPIDEEDTASESEDHDDTVDAELKPRYTEDLLDTQAEAQNEGEE
eukprot:m.32932 g.32932  ORF g.32932 m.32932 type:complete len:390 (-) comp8468_c0_seq2:64-1233(-)